MKSVWITMVTVRSLLLISVSWVARPTSRELRSGIEIILGMVPSGFPVFKATIPGCSRNGSGTCPYLRVQKKFVKFGQRTQNTSLCSTNFLGQFFSNLASNLLWNLCNLLFGHIWNERVLRLDVPRTFFCFSWNNCQFLLIP